MKEVYFEENYIPIIGQMVPDIELEAFYKGKTRKIKPSDYRSKWLIMLFYPADFTFVCPTELEAAAENYNKFKSEGAEIVSISTDTVFVHKAWHDNSEAIKKIKYPMLADPAGKMCRALGTYLKEEGVSLRTTIIVDPHGVIKSYEIHDNDIGRNIEEILRKLQAAKFTAEHKGYACPVNWIPGGKTLKPGLNLVGKI